MIVQRKQNNPGAKKKRITFFVKAPMDTFIDDVQAELTNQYTVKKVVVTNLNQLEEAMNATDICWFDGCELAIHATNMENITKNHIILELRSSEAFEYLQAVNWDIVGTVIFETESIRKFVLEANKSLSREKTYVIAQGIAVNKLNFKDSRPGCAIAYAGNINYEQGPMLLLQVFKRIYDKDSRYKLHIAGYFQEPRYVLYFEQMLSELGLTKNVVCEEPPNDMDKWLEDKDYIISTSLLEGHQTAILQGMAKGLKPLIHNFIGAKELYPAQYIWNNISECEKMVYATQASASEYREFVQQNYSLQKQLSEVRKLVEGITFSS